MLYLSETDWIRLIILFPVVPIFLQTLLYVWKTSLVRTCCILPIILCGWTPRLVPYLTCCEWCWNRPWCVSVWDVLCQTSWRSRLLPAWASTSSGEQWPHLTYLGVFSSGTPTQSPLGKCQGASRGRLFLALLRSFQMALHRGWSSLHWHQRWVRCWFAHS